MKKISIIIPCYKYAHYLKECLDSVFAQTYPVHEIIVVSDGSPDIEEIKEVLKKFPTVQFFHKENGGLSSARNFGISKSTGEYITCLDADDKLVPGAIEEHVKLLTDDMTIAQCSLMEFGDSHQVYPPKETSLKQMLSYNTVYCNALFPRKAWVDSGGYDESEIMRLGFEDWEFWIRLLDLGYKVNVSSFIALRYRMHESSMTVSNTRPNAQKLYMYIWQKHIKLYKLLGVSIRHMEENII